MSLPSFDPKNPPAWFCTCRRCGSNGKVLPRRTWYNHNPGGKAAKYEAIANRAIEELGLLRARPHPVYEARGRRLHGEVEGVEDPPRSSERVAASGSSVRRDTTGILPESENEIHLPSCVPTHNDYQNAPTPQTDAAPARTDFPTPAVAPNHTPDSQGAESNVASSSKIPKKLTPARASHKAATKKSPQPKEVAE